MQRRVVRNLIERKNNDQGLPSGLSRTLPRKSEFAGASGSRKKGGSLVLTDESWEAMKSETSPFKKEKLHCEVCGASCLDRAEFNAHLNGRRHLQRMNKKVQPKSAENENRTLVTLMPSIKDARNDDDLSNVLTRIARSEPLLGLKFVSRIQTGVSFVESLYTCHLCKLESHVEGITRHLFSKKHMLKYIEDRHYNIYRDITSFPNSDNKPISQKSVRDAAYQIMEKEGGVENVGTIRVRVPNSSSTNGDSPGAVHDDGRGSQGGSDDIDEELQKKAASLAQREKMLAAKERFILQAEQEVQRIQRSPPKSSRHQRRSFSQEKMNRSPSRSRKEKSYREVSPMMSTESRRSASNDQMIMKSLLEDFKVSQLHCDTIRKMPETSRKTLYDLSSEEKKFQKSLIKLKDMGSHKKMSSVEQLMETKLGQALRKLEVDKMELLFAEKKKLDTKRRRKDERGGSPGFESSSDDFRSQERLSANQKKDIARNRECHRESHDAPSNSYDKNRDRSRRERSNELHRSYSQNERQQTERSVPVRGKYSEGHRSVRNRSENGHGQMSHHGDGGHSRSSSRSVNYESDRAPRHSDQVMQQRCPDVVQDRRGFDRRKRSSPPLVRRIHHEDSDGSGRYERSRKHQFSPRDVGDHRRRFEQYHSPKRDLYDKCDPHFTSYIKNAHKTVEGKISSAAAKGSLNSVADAFIKNPTLKSALNVLEEDPRSKKEETRSSRTRSSTQEELIPRKRNRNRHGSPHNSHNFEEAQPRRYVSNSDRFPVHKPRGGRRYSRGENEARAFHPSQGGATANHNVLINCDQYLPRKFGR
ncbi:uncharacterized protein LOC143448923 isoform X1 [Clavelina lepadiformis]|uniref:uncharacterized protein LOC143448923 isoform X1 n=2 Tax=Clavelina lepadiformis TaxID=159417 RepID=UPI004041C97B